MPASNCSRLMKEAIDGAIEKIAPDARKALNKQKKRKPTGYTPKAGKGIDIVTKSEVALDKIIEKSAKGEDTIMKVSSLVNQLVKNGVSKQELDLYFGHILKLEPRTKSDKAMIRAIRQAVKIDLGLVGKRAKDLTPEESIRLRSGTTSKALKAGVLKRPDAEISLRLLKEILKDNKIKAKVISNNAYKDITHNSSIAKNNYEVKGWYIPDFKKASANHFEDSNKGLLGWSRSYFTEFKGKKVLRLEEFQSDWAQSPKLKEELGDLPINYTDFKKLAIVDGINRAIRGGRNTMIIPINRGHGLAGSYDVMEMYRDLNNGILPKLRKELKSQELDINIKHVKEGEGKIVPRKYDRNKKDEYLLYDDEYFEIDIKLSDSVKNKAITSKPGVKEKKFFKDVVRNTPAIKFKDIPDDKLVDIAEHYTDLSDSNYRTINELLSGNDVNIDGVTFTPDDVDIYDPVYSVSAKLARALGLIDENKIYKKARLGLHKEFIADYATERNMVLLIDSYEDSHIASFAKDDGYFDTSNITKNTEFINAWSDSHTLNMSKIPDDAYIQLDASIEGLDNSFVNKIKNRYGDDAVKESEWYENTFRKDVVLAENLIPNREVVNVSGYILGSPDTDFVSKEYIKDITNVFYDEELDFVTKDLGFIKPIKQEDFISSILDASNNEAYKIYNMPEDTKWNEFFLDIANSDGFEYLEEDIPFTKEKFISELKGSIVDYIFNYDYIINQNTKKPVWDFSYEMDGITIDNYYDKFKEGDFPFIDDIIYAINNTKEIKKANEVKIRWDMLGILSALGLTKQQINKEEN